MRETNGLLPRLNLGELPTFPRVLELQTISFCNAKCLTCPYDEVYGRKPGRRMPDELLWRLLGECKVNRQNVSQIVPYHNNEPFSDHRLADIVSFVSNEIGVPIELSTNASIAQGERAERVVRGIRTGTIRISFFGANKQSYEQRMVGLSWEKSCANIANIIELRNRFSPDVQIEIVMIAAYGLSHEEVLVAKKLWEPNASVVVLGYLDRAGNNLNHINVLPQLRFSTRLLGCDLNRPFERMNINAEGKAVLCSQDWRGEVVLADLNETTIQVAWTSPQYETVRSQITGSRPSPKEFLCRSCKLAILE
jgi:hypothetical protein